MNILNSLLKPSSIAIIGASRSKGKVGNQVLKNILQSGFKGSVYPINPHAQSIYRLQVYPSILDTPTIPELAVIVTPSGLVKPVVQECIQKGVTAAIVITAGFAETSSKGEQAQQEIQEMAKQSIRLLGPNCLGVISPTHHLNASFGPQFDIKGDIMLISQSGAMVTGVLDWSNATQMGISHCITLGNRIDISENEALEFAAKDPNTNIILAYIESFQQASEFFSIASKISSQKPIVLLKGGSSVSGQHASASHTAALATNQVLISAFAKQTGVILAKDIQHWLKTAELLKKTPSSDGKDVAIITNAGGPGVVATDEAESHQLTVQPLTKLTQQQLQHSFQDINPNNPLDIRGDAVPEDFATAIEIVLKDKIQDSLVVIITPQTTTQPKKAVKYIIKLAGDSNKPILVVLLGGTQMQPAKKLLDAANIPNFTFPNQAIELLATKIEHQHNATSGYIFPATHISVSASKPVTSKDLTLKKAFRLLKHFHFHLPKYQIISQITHVPAAMRMVGKPAVIKTASMSITHKVLAGGVKKNVMSNHQARMSFRKISQLHPQVLFQQTIHAQTEVILGAKRDPSLGAFITLGLGGSLTNVLADRQYAFIPCQTNYLKKILKQSKLYQQISHNQDQVNLVIENLNFLQQLVLSHPEIAEVEINPLLLTTSKAYAVDIKIKLM